MKFIFIVLVFFFINGELFSQKSEINTNNNYNSYSYFLNHSIGYGFDQQKPVFTISLSKLLGKRYSLGIKGGIYNYSQKTTEAATDFINPYYSTLSPGVYSVQVNSLDVVGTTYIAGLQASFRINSKLTTDISLGSAEYSKKTYSVNVRFSKSFRDAPPLKPSDVTVNNILPGRVKDIWKLYISAGLNYRFEYFGLGVYSDNIYSAGISAGVFF